MTDRAPKHGPTPGLASKSLFELEVFVCFSVVTFRGHESRNRVESLTNDARSGLITRRKQWTLSRVFDLSSTDERKLLEGNARVISLGEFWMMKFFHGCAVNSSRLTLINMLIS